MSETPTQQADNPNNSPRLDTSNPPTQKLDVSAHQAAIREILEFATVVHVDAAYPGQHYHGINLPQAAVAITKLIEAAATQQAIEELESLYVDHDERKLRHIDGSKLMTIDDRLAQLRSQQEGSKR